MAENLLGMIFGRLIVEAKAPSIKRGRHTWALWHCKCVCGKRKLIQASSLKSGNTKSCGCLRDGHPTHGHTKGGRHTVVFSIFHNAKHRAKRDGLEFAIDLSDISIPERCPLLGIRLFRGIGRGNQLPSSPTLDRIENSEGYVKGNVWVISHRANAIKHDASLTELKMVVSGLEKLQKFSVNS